MGLPHPDQSLRRTRRTRLTATKDHADAGELRTLRGDNTDSINDDAISPAATVR
jgi:hypothetical protein